MTEYLTRQQIFDKVYLGLKSQDFEQSLDGGSCVYRGESNRKCAAGYLIPDETYDHHIEGLEFIDLQKNIKEASGINFNDYKFVMGLQDIHDNAEDGEDMQNKMHNYAIRHKLTVPKVWMK